MSVFCYLNYITIALVTFYEDTKTSSMDGVQVNVEYVSHVLEMCVIYAQNFSNGRKDGEYKMERISILINNLDMIM